MQAPRIAHLCVYDGFVDWEPAFAIAGIHNPQFQREPGRWQVRTVGERPGARPARPTSNAASYLAGTGYAGGDRYREALAVNGGGLITAGAMARPRPHRGTPRPSSPRAC